MLLTFYSSVANESKSKVKKFCGLIITFREIKDEILLGVGFLALFLSRVKNVICSKMGSSHIDLITLHVYFVPDTGKPLQQYN